MRRGLTVIALLSALGAPGVTGGGDARLESYGRHLARECTSCHRIDGVDNGIPSIAGWDPDRFVAMLRFYQTGARTNPVMVSVAQSLDEEQLKALAAYYGSLPRPATAGKGKR